MTKILDTLNFFKWRISWTTLLTKGKIKNPSERESERKNFTPKVPGEEYQEENLSTELAMQSTLNLSKFPDKMFMVTRSRDQRNEISKSPKNIILIKIIFQCQK